MIVIQHPDVYIICNPTDDGLQIGLIAVRPLTKSPLEIKTDGQLKHISLSFDLNNQPVATFKKDLFLPYV